MRQFKRTAEEARAELRARVLAPVVRWGHARKAEMFIAIDRGVVTVADVMEAHGFDAAEFAQWQAAWKRGGPPALAVKARGAA